MSPRKLAAFMLDEELIEGLKAIQERDGLPQSVQVRRVLEAYLREQGVLKEGTLTKTKRRRNSSKVGTTPCLNTMPALNRQPP